MLLQLRLVICIALYLAFVPNVQSTQLNLTTTPSGEVLYNVERTPASTLLSLHFLQQNLTNTTKGDNFYLAAPRHFHESLVGTKNETEGIGKFSSTTTKLNAQHAAEVNTQQQQSPHYVANRQQNLYVDNIGYIHFEPTESVYNMPEEEPENTQNIQEVLLHLFPQGVGDMFRFSHASEPAPTTSTKRPNHRNLGQTFKKLHANVENADKFKPKILYGLEASISMEHNKQPGHREIIAQKITLEPPTAISQQILSQADILKINKATTIADNTTTTSPTKTDAAYILVNDLPTDMDEVMANDEDNRIAESRNVHLVHTLHNLPTYVEQVYDQPVFDYNYNQLLGPMGEEIQLQQASMAREFLISYNPLLDVKDNVDVVVSDQNFGRKLKNSTQHQYQRQQSELQPQQQTRQQKQRPQQKQRQQQEQRKESSEDYELELAKSMEIPLEQKKTLEATTPTTTSTASTPSSTTTTTAATSRTEVEIQKSINTRNTQITEQNGRLLEMHETIYDGRSNEGRTISHQSTNNYAISTKKPSIWNIPSSTANSYRNEQRPIYYKPSTTQTYVIPYQQSVAIPLNYQQRPSEVVTQNSAPHQLEKFVKKILQKNEPTQTERTIDHFMPATTTATVAVPVPVPVPVPVMPKLLPSVNTLALNPMQTYFLHKLLVPGHLKKPGPPKKVINSEMKEFPFKVQKFNIMSKLPIFKNDVTAMDLYPPPPPTINSNWFKGSRYIYNTLPKNMAIAETTAYGNAVYAHNLPFGSEMNDDFRWRIGHVLKRSAQHLTPPKIEYGFKPPLIPSVKLDTSGQLVEPESLHVK